MTASAESVTRPDIVQGVRSHMQGLGIPEPSLVPMCDGCHNKVYRCDNAEPAFPVNKVIVRVPICPEAARAVLANVCYEDDVPAPQTYRVEVLAGTDTPIVFEEFIQGEHPDLNKLSPEQVYKFAHAVARVHDKTSDFFSEVSGTPPSRRGSHGDYLQAMVTESVTSRILEGQLELSDETNILISAGLETLDAHLKKNHILFGGSTFRRQHHDLNPGNILLCPDGDFKFVDSNWTYGDPADEVDYAVSNNSVTPKFKELFYEAYTNITGRYDTLERIGAYTLKNQLDDLVWVLDMQRQFNEDERYGQAAYDQRLQALECTLDTWVR